MQWSSVVKNNRWNFQDIASVGAVNHMTRLLGQIVLNKSCDSFCNYLSPGYHFLFNNQLNEHLGSDGYDNYQAPVAEDRELFARRMWVKGSLQFHHPIKINQLLSCREKVALCKYIDGQAFVNVEREFNCTESNKSLLKEIRMLMYTNKPYANDKSSSSVEDPNGLPTHTQKLTVNESQVLKFSCLSYNLHKIHLDSRYCQKEGLTDIILQGPFIITIGLNWFLQLYPNSSIKSFNYKNVNPVYINETNELQVFEIDANRYKLQIARNNVVLFIGDIVTI